MKLTSMSGDAQNELEAFVDTYGLAMVLGALANICAEKSAHIAENWQDVVTAKSWLRAMNALDRVSCTNDIELVS